MGWVYANDRMPYEGETHELLGKTYSGKTRTPMSRRLEWEEPKPQPLLSLSNLEPRQSLSRVAHQRGTD